MQQVQAVPAKATIKIKRMLFISYLRCGTRGHPESTTGFDFWHLPFGKTRFMVLLSALDSMGGAVLWAPPHR